MLARFADRPDAREKTAILILGMHRSGTSVLARICNLLGFDLGGKIMPPKSDNETGFWENEAVVSVHEQIFETIGASWDDMTPLPPNWRDNDEVLGLAEQLKSVCRSEFGDSDKWCIKDPRSSRLLPIWIDLLDDMNVRPVAAVTFRNPLAVAESLAKRNRLPLNHSCLAWLRHNLEAIEHTSEIPRVFISYESLLEDWRRAVAGLGQAFSIDLREAIERSSSEIDSFVDPRLSHHSAENHIDELDPRFGHWVERLHGALCEAQDLGPSKIQSRTRTLKTEVEKADAASRELAEELRNRRKLINEQAAEIAEREEWIASLQAEIASRDQTIAEREEWIASLQAEIESIRQSLSWRLTGPLRFGKRAVRRLVSRMEPYLAVAARNAYRALPLPHGAKLILRSFALRSGTWARRAVAPSGPASDGSPPGMRVKKVVEGGESRDVDFGFAAASEPRVSIVIPVYNKLDYTLRCLRSIHRHRPRASFEVIVADDHSTDETAELLGQVRGLRLIRHEANKGFLMNCNAAAKASRGRYLYFLNNDTEVRPGFLDELVRTFETTPLAGLVGSKLLAPDGRLQEAGGIIFDDGGGWNYGRGARPDEPRYNYLRETDYCSGCSFLIPKELWNQLGGFDEQYAPAYYEDTDLAFAVRARGRKVFYQPLSQVFHHEGVSSGTDVSQGVKSFQIVNQKKFHDKWKAVLANYGQNGKNVERRADRYAKRRVLIIDSVTPTPERDAGSLRTFNLIKMLVSLGSKITFIPEDNIAYMDDHTPNLQRLGVECLYFPHITSVNGYLRKSLADFDVVFLERGAAANKYIDTIKSAAPDLPVIFDTHDLHYLRLERQAELENTERLRSEARAMKRSELRVMSRADCTIVVSRHEKQVLEKESPSTLCEILPLFMEPDPQSDAFERRNGIVFIGSFLHPPNADAVLHFSREIWPIVKTALPGAVFHVVGGPVPPQIRDLNGNDVRIEGNMNDLRPLFGTCRLSVAPLRFGAGVKGKIGTSLALGLPCVATAVAAEGAGLTHEKDIIVAEDSKAFAEQVIRLHEDEALWKRLSDGGLQFVEDNYSAKVNSPKIAKLLDRFCPLDRDKDGES